MQFIDFVGNEKVKLQTEKLFLKNTFPHAILIEGQKGLGKKTFAKIIAKALVCKAPLSDIKTEDKPCGICSACVKVEKNLHPDVTFLQGGEKARSFHVDVIREMRETLFILPNESEKRIVILNNAHNMTEQAENALLKIVEEPPRHVVFILLSPSRLYLSETVRSRLVCFALHGVLSDDAVNLVSDRMNIDFVTAKETLKKANGNIGQAFLMLDEDGFGKTEDVVCEVAKALVAGREIDFLKATALVEKDLADEVLRVLHEEFHDALVFKSGASHTENVSEIAKFIAAKLTAIKIVKVINEMENLQYKRQFNINFTLFITLFGDCLWQAKS